jgi:thiol:disulfide interchange protein
MIASLAYGTILLGSLLTVFGLVSFVRGRSRRASIVGWLCIAAAIALLSVNWFGHFWAVDSCLDSGGRYNYESHVCELK